MVWPTIVLPEREEELFAQSELLGMRHSQHCDCRDCCDPNHYGVSGEQLLKIINLFRRSRGESERESL